MWVDDNNNSKTNQKNPFAKGGQHPKHTHAQSINQYSMQNKASDKTREKGKDSNNKRANSIVAVPKNKKQLKKRGVT